MWILHNKKKIQLKKTMKSNLNREGTKTCNLSKIYAKFHCFKEFILHHYLCFIIVQHPCANKRNIISILLFFLHSYLLNTHTDKNILLTTLKWTNSSCSTTQFNVPWTRWSNTHGLFAYLTNRQDKGPALYTRTKPSKPQHLIPTIS